MVRSGSGAALLVQELTQQAPVTAWPERLLLTLAVVAVTALVVWGMWRNWRRRAARQDWVELPAGPPADFDPQQRFAGRYVASVASGDWLDRIAAQGLGMPGRASVQAGPDGLLIEREGERSLYLPAGAIAEVDSARGIAQEVYERDGVVAITWRSGPGTVTTGLRMGSAEDHLALIGAVQRMMGNARGDSEERAQG